jgi:hypothetical protein
MQPTLCSPLIASAFSRTQTSSKAKKRKFDTRQLPMGKKSKKPNPLVGQSEPPVEQPEPQIAQKNPPMDSENESMSDNGSNNEEAQLLDLDGIKNYLAESGEVHLIDADIVDAIKSDLTNIALITDGKKLANLLQPFWNIGTQTQKLKASDINIKMPNVSVEALKTLTARDLLLHGNGILDVAIFCSDPTAPYSITTGYDKLEDDEYINHLSSCADAIAFFAFGLLKQAKWLKDNDHVGSIITSILKLKEQPSTYALAIGTADIDKYPVDWVKHIKFDNIGEAIKNRLALGTAGYRFIQYLNSTKPGKKTPREEYEADLEDKLRLRYEKHNEELDKWIQDEEGDKPILKTVDYISVDNMKFTNEQMKKEEVITKARHARNLIVTLFKTIGLCWEYHPLFKDSSLITKIGSLNVACAAIIQKCYTQEQIDQAYNDKSLFRGCIQNTAIGRSTHEAWVSDTFSTDYTQILTRKVFNKDEIKKILDGVTN